MMTDANSTDVMEKSRGRRGRGRRGAKSDAPARSVDYHNLKNPFKPANVFSDDRVEAIHAASLRTLEELGMKVLLPQAREIYRKGGAIVDEDTEMVRIGRDIVEAAVASAPKSILAKGGRPERDLDYTLGTLTIQSGAGCPHATDRIRGRRPGSIQDYEELVRIVQAYDALHLIGPIVEPQDVAPHLRHYAMTRAMMTMSDKFPFVYSRGTQHVEDAFDMIAIAREISRDDFEKSVYCYTIINTNSPRQLDIPMAQGLIDLARAGQMSVITPFCLMGAMAPVTVAGALTLSHAEALAAITLTQLVKPGAPVQYGAFASNVDMKSGAPAFGTPEQIKANLGSGQLARKLGLPWRCAAGSAANVNDAQAAGETIMSAWSAVLAGCTMLVHGAGWLEGGLTISYEKMITDMEAMQIFAELCTPTDADDDAIGFDALAEVPPGGHFFAAEHTMSRYATAFYDPMVADWSNFGTWTERGAKDASERATEIWQEILAPEPDILLPADRVEALDAFIARRSEEGGAPPVS